MAVFDGVKSLALSPSRRMKYLGRQMTAGKFYTITAVPFMVGSVIALALPTIMRLCGYGWSMYPVAVLYGLPAPSFKDGLYDLVLHSHVWVAWLFMALLVVQMVTSAYRHKSVYVRLTHRVLGKYVAPACLCWLLPTSIASLLLNTAYTRLELIVAVAITSFETVMIVVNFIWAYKEAVKRDIPKHKDIMMIMTLWALNPGWDRFNAMLLQLAMPNCWTGTVGLAGSAWAANLEMAIYLVLVSKRARTMEESYVRVNLTMFGVRQVAFTLFTAAAWFMGWGSECFSLGR